MVEEAKLALLEGLDGFAQMRNILRNISQQTGEYAGMPCAIEGERLVIEPSYPWASIFTTPPSEAEEETRTHRNTFYSHRYRMEVVVWEEEGKITWGFVPHAHGRRVDQMLHTMSCACAWGIEQEHNALVLLGQHIAHHTFRDYVLTGMFLERSERSGVMYLFRRLKPTVAFSMKHEDHLKVLACLCMHPIGYYEDTWAGAMCPTDDVMAHLMLMRADEHMFWKRCTQHPAWRAESGF